uniref:Uncharacterized protein n=1 Tax=Coccidioides posadasii RMSCC 3488 TaxID=454284 RepID=A0A0J6FQF6_COCPO|nr:hypothetical protein CPAG_08892 [Coccidioides posadasii RMSCC 3488]
MSYLEEPRSGTRFAPRRPGLGRECSRRTSVREEALSSANRTFFCGLISTREGEHDASRRRAKVEELSKGSLRPFSGRLFFVNSPPPGPGLNDLQSSFGDKDLDSRLADEDRALLGSTATNIDDNGGRDGEEDDEETGEGSRVRRPSLCDDRETLREPDTGERERDRSLFSLCRDVRVSSTTRVATGLISRNLEGSIGARGGERDAAFPELPGLEGRGPLGACVLRGLPSWDPEELPGELGGDRKADAPVLPKPEGLGRLGKGFAQGLRSGESGGLLGERDRGTNAAAVAATDPRGPDEPDPLESDGPKGLRSGEVEEALEE